MTYRDWALYIIITGLALAIFIVWWEMYGPALSPLLPGLIG